ncbi:MAG: macro domain-containing protein [Roseiflexaceae bacterium]
MQLILSAIQPDLARAWAEICGDLPGVMVHHGSILDLECDALVSPANSFGFMNGGIDLFYSRFFGWELQERVQQAIRVYHHGELLVGAAELVATGHPRFPYLIAAPTMRMPMTVRESANPYLAARATFLLWRHGVVRDGPQAGVPAARALRSVAMPGLGTGVGSVAPEVCARQVRAAFEDVLLERFVAPQSWGQVLQRHEEWLGGPLSDP